MAPMTTPAIQAFDFDFDFLVEELEPESLLLELSLEFPDFEEREAYMYDARSATVLVVFCR